MRRLKLILALGLGALAFASCDEIKSSECGDGVVCPPGHQCIEDLSFCLDPEHNPTCGNGVLDPGEECDDGNLNNHDGCNWDCRLPACGDGLVDPDLTEVCDDGMRCADGSDCTVSRDCGALKDVYQSVEKSDEDGKAYTAWIDPSTGKEMDLECRPRGGYGCSADCRVAESCGDGILSVGEECDFGPYNGRTVSPDPNEVDFCTDSPFDPSDETVSIDEQNRQNCENRSCSSQCTIVQCGNGVVDQGETCDLGGTCKLSNKPCIKYIEGDSCQDEDEEDLCELNEDEGCSNECQLLSGWKCFQGTMDVNNPEHQHPTDSTKLLGCRPETRCGDGIVAGAEECDDENNESGDGCSDECMLETGWSCEEGRVPHCKGIIGDGLILGDEVCDDGNADSGDGCDSQGQEEPGWECPTAGELCIPNCTDKVQVSDLTGPACGGYCADVSNPNVDVAHRCGDSKDEGCREDNDCLTGFCGQDQKCADLPSRAAHLYASEDALDIEVNITSELVDSKSVDLGGREEDFTYFELTEFETKCGAHIDYDPSADHEHLFIDLLSWGSVDSPKEGCGENENGEYVDSFTYYRCPYPDLSQEDQTCTEETAQIIINRKPQFTLPSPGDSRLCAVSGDEVQADSETISIDLNDYFSDVDGDRLNFNSITVDWLNPDHADNDLDGSFDVTDGVITFTPENVVIGDDYEFKITACDEGSAEKPSACIEDLLWTVFWDSPPELKVYNSHPNAIPLLVVSTSTLELYNPSDTANSGESIIVEKGAKENTDFVFTVFNDSREGTAVTTKDGSCSIVTDENHVTKLEFFANGTPVEDAVCKVRVCTPCEGESANLCSTTEVHYTVTSAPVLIDDKVAVLIEDKPSNHRVIKIGDLIENDSPGSITVDTVSFPDVDENGNGEYIDDNGQFNVGATETVSRCGVEVEILQEDDDHDSRYIFYKWEEATLDDADSFCQTRDEFEYAVTMESGDTVSSRRAKVTVNFNHPPKHDPVNSCVPMTQELNLLNVATGFQDEDGDEVLFVKACGDLDCTAAHSEIGSSGSVLTWDRPSGLSGVSESVVHSATVRACDRDRDNETYAYSGCVEFTWTNSWVRAPLAAAPIRPDVEAAKPVTVPLAELINTTVADADLLHSVTVSDSFGGNFANTANPLTGGENDPLGAGGECEVIAGDDGVGSSKITYTASTTPGNYTCYVKTCNECGAGDGVCTITPLTFRVGCQNEDNDDSLCGDTGDPGVKLYGSCRNNGFCAYAPLPPQNISRTVDGYKVTVGWTSGGQVTPQDHIEIRETSSYRAELTKDDGNTVAYTCLTDATGSGSGLTCIFSHVDTGEYGLRVLAINEIGESHANVYAGTVNVEATCSAHSECFDPRPGRCVDNACVYPPGKPEQLEVSMPLEGSNYVIKATWAPPTDPGTSVVDEYELEVYDGSDQIVASCIVSATPPQSPYSCDPKDDGDDAPALSQGAYTVKVTAKSVVGIGESASRVHYLEGACVAPEQCLARSPEQGYCIAQACQYKPLAPTGTAQVSGKDIQVTWFPPADDGNSPLIDYKVSLKTSSGMNLPAHPTETVAAGESSYTRHFPSLDAEEYEIEILVENTHGQSPKLVLGGLEVTTDSCSQNSDCSTGYICWNGSCQGVPDVVGPPTIDTKPFLARQVNWTQLTVGSEAPPIESYRIKVEGVTDSSYSANYTASKDADSLTINLPEPGDYKASVAAVNAVGQGAFSQAISFSVSLLPGVPKNFKALPSSTDFTVAFSWTTPELNHGGNLSYSMTFFEEGGTTPLSSVTGCDNLVSPAESCNANFVSDGPGAYRAELTATNDVGTGEAAEVVFIVVTECTDTENSHCDAGESCSASHRCVPAIPGTPQTLAAQQGAGNAPTIDISWESPGEDSDGSISHYEVKVDGPSGSNSAGKIYNVTPQSGVNQLSAPITKGGQYSVEVSAVNVTGKGQAATATPVSVLFPPSKPQNFAATRSNTDFTVDLSWVAPIENGGQAITGYTVQFTDLAGAPLLPSPGLDCDNLGGGASSCQADFSDFPDFGPGFYWASIYASAGQLDSEEVYVLIEIERECTDTVLDFCGPLDVCSNDGLCEPGEVPGAPENFLVSTVANPFGRQFTWDPPAVVGSQAITGYTMVISDEDDHVVALDGCSAANIGNDSADACSEVLGTGFYRVSLTASNAYGEGLAVSKNIIITATCYDATGPTDPAYVGCDSSEVCSPSFNCVPGAAPDAPKNFQAEPDNDNPFLYAFTWQAPDDTGSGDINAYELEILNSSNASVGLTNCASLDGTATSCTEQLGTGVYVASLIARNTVYGDSPATTKIIQIIHECYDGSVGAPVACGQDEDCVGGFCVDTPEPQDPPDPPGQVKNIQITPDDQVPTLTVTWEEPGEPNDGDIVKYELSLHASDHTMIGNVVVHTNTTTLSQDFTVPEDLGEYYVQITAYVSDGDEGEIPGAPAQSSNWEKQCGVLEEVETDCADKGLTEPVCSNYQCVEDGG